MNMNEVCEPVHIHQHVHVKELKQKHVQSAETCTY
jgi:hypothetical protein